MSAKWARGQAVTAASKELMERYPRAFDIYRWIASVAEDEKGTPKGSIYRKRTYRQAITDLREDHPDDWKEMYDRWVEYFNGPGDRSTSSQDE